MGADVNLIRRFFWLMPTSIGVAYLKADTETIIKRNHEREKVKETAHENRDFMVPLMQEPIRVALEVLRERGVPICEIDVQDQSIEDARKQLVNFAGQKPFDTTTPGPCGEMEILSPPTWWQ